MIGEKTILLAFSIKLSKVTSNLISLLEINSATTIIISRLD